MSPASASEDRANRLIAAVVTPTHPATAAPDYPIPRAANWQKSQRARTNRRGRTLSRMEVGAGGAFAGKVHRLDATVGGTHKMSFRNFTTAQSHAFGGRYLELVPHERIRYTHQFEDPNLPGEM